MTLSFCKNETFKVQNFELFHVIATEAVIVFFKKNKIYVYFSSIYNFI